MYGVRVSWIGASRRGRSLSVMCLIIGLGLSACGGQSDPTAASSPSTTTTVATPEPTPSYAFADYQFIHLGTPSGCSESVKLGNKRAVTIVAEYREAPFVPDCVTDVKLDKISVTIVNQTDLMHNFIVQGDDFELVLQPGQRKTVRVDLAQQPEIDFQCTIHLQMHGAFFR